MRSTLRREVPRIVLVTPEHGGTLVCGDERGQRKEEVRNACAGQAESGENDLVEESGIQARNCSEQRTVQR